MMGRAVTWAAAFRLGAVVAAFSGASALVASGCGSQGESYYCDSTGCYQCDGYGCGSVTPPPAKPCTGNTSCPAGQVCTSSGCEQTCKSSSDCAKGTVCTGGFCLPPTQTDAGSPVECTANKDCPGGDVCIQNHCQACGGNNGPCPCTTSPES